MDLRASAVGLVFLTGCAFGIAPSGGDDAGATVPGDQTTPPPRRGNDAQAPSVTISVPFNLHECSSIECPPEARYPVGCADIVMTGNSTLGCVAHASGSPQVAFETGNTCVSDDVSGRVLCSSAPGDALSPSNCPLPRSQALYLTTLSHCDY